MLSSRAEAPGGRDTAAPPLQDSVFQQLRERDTLLRGRYHTAVWAADGSAAELRIPIRRRERGRRVVSQPDRGGGTAGSGGAFLWKPDRREVRRTLRGEGNHVGGRRG